MIVNDVCVYVCVCVCVVCVCVCVCMCVCVCVCSCRSKKFVSIMSKCLVKQPAGRASAQELLEHPFIANVSDYKPLRFLYQVSGVGVAGGRVETGSAT